MSKSLFLEYRHFRAILGLFNHQDSRARQEMRRGRWGSLWKLPRSDSNPGSTDLWDGHLQGQPHYATPAPAPPPHPTLLCFSSQMPSTQLQDTPRWLTLPVGCRRQHTARHGSCAGSRSTCPAPDPSNRRSCTSRHRCCSPPLREHKRDSSDA